MASRSKKGNRSRVLGGITADPIVKIAAEACALGLPGWRMMETTDQVELGVLIELTNTAIEAWDRRQNQISVRIANAVGKMLSGGK